MSNEELLRELQALRDTQERLVSLVASRELTTSTPELPGADLGRIYRTQGVKAFREALKAQNRERTAEYQKRGIAI